MTGEYIYLAPEIESLMSSGVDGITQIEPETLLCKQGHREMIDA
jgi:hypothetical protein